MVYDFDDYRILNHVTKVVTLEVGEGAAGGQNIRRFWVQFPQFLSYSILEKDKIERTRKNI